jgi:hypothetical protein
MEDRRDPVNDDVAKFWREFETETGERVQAKAVGELYEGDREKGVWFLLVLTDKSFWFKQMPTSNPLASLLGPRLFAPRPAIDYTLKIPREDLVSLEEPEPRSWFARFAFPKLTLTWREGEATSSRRFSMDPSMDLLPQLRELFKGDGA